MRITVDNVRAFAEALVNLRNSATDEAAAENPAAFDEWEIGNTYKSGIRVRHNGVLYKYVGASETVAQSDWAPDVTPSLWTEILPGQEGTEIGPWRQPDSTNTYHIGSRVYHNGKLWECTYEPNSWEPGVYGWKEITE